jgi:hypothetical protein
VCGSRRDSLPVARGGRGWRRSARRSASAEHGLLKSLQKTTRGGIREKRRGERRARVPKGGGGVTWLRRI